MTVRILSTRHFEPPSGMYSEAWAFQPTASNAGELRDMVSNPLDPSLLTAPERLSKVASLLARGILRRRSRTADGKEPERSRRPLPPCNRQSHPGSAFLDHSNGAVAQSPW